MLAVAAAADALAADPRIEVKLSPRLQTAPLPVTPAGVADRWRNIGSCQKTSLHNALQIEKMLRIAGKRTKTDAKPLGPARSVPEPVDSARVLRPPYRGRTEDGPL